MAEIVGPALPAWLAAGALLTFAAGAPAETCQPLMIQGNPAACACSSEGWAALEAQLKTLPEIAAPQELRGLIRTFLCRSGARASATLHRSMPKLIARSTWETGESKAAVSRLPRGELGPLAGRAWDASLSGDGAQLQLSYAPNEACVASASFAYRAAGWLLVGVDDACD